MQLISTATGLAGFQFGDEAVRARGQLNFNYASGRFEFELGSVQKAVIEADESRFNHTNVHAGDPQAAEPWARFGAKSVAGRTSITNNGTTAAANSALVTVRGSTAPSSPGWIQAVIGNNGTFDVSDPDTTNTAVRMEPIYRDTSVLTTNYVRITSSGQLQRSTSSARYKDNIRDCPVTAAMSIVLALKPRYYEAQTEDLDAEVRGAHYNEDGDLVPAENPPRKTHTFLGLIAEEVHEADPCSRTAPAHYETQSVLAALIGSVQCLHAELAQAKAELAALRGS